MQTTLARNEKLLLGAIVSFVVLFICLFSQISMKQEIASGIIPNAGFINYEMGRPLSENISEYSLEGRDVDHIYEGLKAKAAAQLADIKTGELKKAELKKKVVAAPKSQAQVKPLPAAATKAVPAPVIAASAPSEAYSSKSSSNNNANRTNYSNSQPDTVGRTAAKTEEIIKSKKTYAQWRTLIFATPTRESIASFIDSYRKGEVTLTEYQLMAQELLLQTGEKYQGLGIYVLRSQPSLQSLSQLTHLSKADLSVPIQTYLNEAVAAYMQESNISVLNQALQTSDKILITKV